MKFVAAVTLAFVVTAWPGAGGEGARLGIEPGSVDFGRLRSGVAVSRVLTFRNFGDETLVIEKVSGDCGCTAVSAVKERLAPGESAELRVTLDLSRGLKAVRGPVVRALTVKSNDVTRPLVEVTLRAEVLGP